MKLTSQSARVAFILAVIDAMKTPTPEFTVGDVERVAAEEVQRRPRFKPCVAEGVEFGSTIEAARYLAWSRRDLWINSPAALRQDAHSVIENLRNRVKNWCNRDNVEGYYWLDPEMVSFCQQG